MYALKQPVCLFFLAFQEAPGTKVSSGEWNSCFCIAVVAGILLPDVK